MHLLIFFFGALFGAALAYFITSARTKAYIQHLEQSTEELEAEVKAKTEQLEHAFANQTEAAVKYIQTEAAKL